ncbi:MAG: hypothetical protein FJ275_06280 [Planctomycetes bacterium]|nr:hypothetical protein [Planctomycetota bacterium]MBM4057831.1 hypothetical protein [Planctomycetota bacterium]
MTPAPRRGSSLAVWLPWVAAPAFFLLPIAGCGGMAALSRQPHAAASPLPGPVAPAATVVAVSTPAR